MKKLFYRCLLLSFSLWIINGCATPEGKKAQDYPHPENNPLSPVMLTGEWVPDDPHDIDFENLPQVPSQHIVISDVRAEDGVNQHNYLVHQYGKFWIMWSDGPGIEDRVGQRV